jgi:GH24 family phage-related lysozyme (muramidase)
MFQPENAVEYLRKHEGVVNFMYQDVVGLVTIGVGFLLAKPASALALPLVRRDTGAPAAAEDKLAEWEAVHARPKAAPPRAYRDFTHLDLPEPAIDCELTARIEAFARNLRSRFPRFEQFPAPAQIGVLDMVYSLGAGGLFRGFPNFCAAVDREDWAACAYEADRRNVSPGRNDDLHQLFLKAAETA